MKVDGDRLVITITSTEGNISVPGDEEVKIGVNVYRKK